MAMEQKVKERVVGAAVLMAAAVIFIPMVLSGPAEDALPRGENAAPLTPPAIPRESSGGFSSRIVPLGEPDREGHEGGDAPGTVPAPVTVPVAPATQPVQEAPPAPAPEPVAAPPPPRPAAVTRPKPSPDGDTAWVVQLGSFANPRNAHALRDRLKSKGYSAFAVSGGAGKDAVTRVYVGPEASRERAERHVSRLLEETRLKGIVVRNPER